MTTAASRPLLRYGLLGLPLSFAALPLVVQWPAHAAAHWGLPLSLVGGLLLAVRLFDAAVDPWIGRRADHWFAQSGARPIVPLLAACALMWLGFVLLFLWVPPASATAPTATAADHGWLIFSAAAALGLATVGYSAAQIIHQAWGARLGGTPSQQARWVGAREAFALLGVLAASVLPSVGGWLATTIVLALLLLLAAVALAGLPAEAASAPAGFIGTSAPVRSAASSPWRTPAFAWLLAVHGLNGLAAAIPASLVLFFVRDRVQAPAMLEPAFLAAYFLAAAAAVPLWVIAVKRLGLVRSWGMGMALSLLTFSSAVSTQPGEVGFYLAICVASGTALGANLVAPAALLAETLRRTGLRGQAEGQWFGWWTMVTKLQAAAAAGLALPVVQGLGYHPGSREPAALDALALTYAALPCAIQAAAALLLWRCRGHWADKPISPQTEQPPHRHAAGASTPPGTALAPEPAHDKP